MDAALRDTVILGTTTNLAFLRALITHPAFAAGEVDTGFIDGTRRTDRARNSVPLAADAALIAAALTHMLGGGDFGASVSLP